MGYTRTTHRELHHLLYSQLKHSASPCNEQETIPYMTAHQLLFSLSYQAPAIVMGLLVAALIPYPPLRAIFVLPGTFVHELLHFIVGQHSQCQTRLIFSVAKKVGAFHLGDGFGGLCQCTLVQRCRDRTRTFDRPGCGHMVCTRRFNLESECCRPEVLGSGSASIRDVPAQLG